ncbi:MAG: hypothetical protein NXI30_16960 [bacterium]|nr:hypothetical protein [bacterium]
MRFPVAHEDFEGRNLEVRIEGFFGSAKLYDGTAQVSGRGKFVLRDNHGEEREIKFKVNWIDPIPTVVIDGTEIRVARALEWYEYVWMGLPVMLVVSGGALGALIGLSAAYSSARIFRSDRPVVSRYALSAVASAIALVVFAVCAVAFQLALEAFRDPTSKAALDDVATATNRDLPIMIDEQTEFYEAEGLEGVLVFKYRAPAAVFEGVDPAVFAARMKPIVGENVCADEELRRDFIDQGVVIRLAYSTTAGDPIASIDVAASDCE